MGDRLKPILFLIETRSCQEQKSCQCSEKREQSKPVTSSETVWKKRRECVRASVCVGVWESEWMCEIGRERKKESPCEGSKYSLPHWLLTQAFFSRCKSTSASWLLPPKSSFCRSTATFHFKTHKNLHEEVSVASGLYFWVIVGHDFSNRTETKRNGTWSDRQLSMKIGFDSGGEFFFHPKKRFEIISGRSRKFVSCGARWRGCEGGERKWTFSDHS